MILDTATDIRISVVRGLFRRCGIDRAVAFAVLGRTWSTIAGGVSLIFVARLLSPNQQGYYYTFASVLGLQVFFELGITYVLMQVASHERASLEWTAAGVLAGEDSARSRLASLFQLALKWYAVVALLMTLVVVPLGIIFFSRSHSGAIGVSWMLPWVWLGLATAATLYLSPFISILEGCGRVAEVAALRMCQSIASNAALWAALVTGLGLYAAPISSTALFVTGAGWLLRNRRAFYVDLLDRTIIGPAIAWRREIWPFQWKIAISWLSGYFIFSLFTPLIFALSGPSAAGRMGMSISIASTPAAIALAWVTTKAAPFGTLVARRDFRSLDAQFGRSLRQSLIIAVLGELIVWVGVCCLFALHLSFAGRILPPQPFGLLVLATICNHYVAAMATYLRAYRREPFLVVAVLNGVLISVFSWYFGRLYGALGMMAVYAAVTLCVGCVGGSIIFTAKRRAWQGQAAGATGTTPCV